MTRLALFAGTALALMLGMSRLLGIYDEGVILTGAMRTAAGDIPHADFYANYGPGLFYLHAALFKAFGESALVERVFDTLVRAGIIVLCFALVERVAERRAAWAAAAVAFLWLFGIGFYGYPLFPVTLLTLAAAALLQPSLAGGKAGGRAFAAGAVVAVAALLRYDVGFALFVAFVAVLLLSPGRRAAIAFVAGTSAAFLGAVAVYCAFAPLTGFVHDILEFTVPAYAPRRSLPFPGLRETLGSLENVAVYSTPLACAAAAALLYAGRAERTPRHWLALTFTVLAAILYLKGLVRVSPIHLMGSIIASIVMLAALAQPAWARGGAWRGGFAVLALATLAAAAHSSAMALSQRMAQRMTMAGALLDPRACETVPELRAIRCFTVGAAREQALLLVARNSAPGERVFIGLGRHDKIVLNDVVSYFALQRMPATRWHHFDSGLQTSERIQRDMVRELETGAVRWVILETMWDGLEEPNESAKSSGVKVLDDYLRARYRVAKAFGEIYVLERAAP